jgi:hypothetical protein
LTRDDPRGDVFPNPNLGIHLNEEGVPAIFSYYAGIAPPEANCWMHIVLGKDGFWRSVNTTSFCEQVGPQPVLSPSWTFKLMPRHSVCRDFLPTLTQKTMLEAKHSSRLERDFP